MKKLTKLFLVALLVTFGFVGCASDAAAETVTSSNEKHYKHTVTVHDRYKQTEDWSRKYGADAKLYKADDPTKFLESITTSYRYVEQDFFGNDGHEFEGSVQLNLWDNGIKQTLEKIASIFKKEETTEVN